MDESEYVITIPNFTPGIYSDDHVTQNGNASPDGSVFNNGAATVDKTYRCHADMTGALVPLPARENRVNEAILPLGAGQPTHYISSNHQESYMQDIKVATVPTGLGVPDAADDVEVHIIHGFVWDPVPVNSFAYYALVRVYQEFNVAVGVTPTKLDVHYQRSGALGGAPTVLSLAWGNLVHSQSHLSGVAPKQLGLGVVSAAMAWVLAKPITNAWQVHGAALSAADLTYTTYDTDVVNTFISDGNIGCVAAHHQSGTAGITFPLSRIAANPGMLPNPNLLGPISPYSTYLVGHQGRLAGAFSYDYAGGWGMSGDQLWFNYYPTYLLHTGTAASPDYAGQILAVPENSNGFGVVASLNAQDLLVINHYGGGAVISGSLNSPTVNVLPNLHSTYGITCQGVSTSLGYVYGGRFGVYAYNGGQSTCISQQLGGFFWDPMTGNTLTRRQDGNRGRFGWWDPYVLTPNDWLYDTESQSWWKLEQPGTREAYASYDVSVSPSPRGGKLYACPWRKTLTSTTTYDRYDHFILSQNFSWQSQPLIESRDRLLTVHRVEFSAVPAPGSTTSQVSVTLRGINEAGTEISSTTQTVTLNVANPRPQRFSVAIVDFSAYYVQVQFQATATGTDAAAAKIMPGANIVCRDAPKFLRTRTA